MTARLALALVVVALVAGACGDDGGGGGSEQARTDAFCEQVRTLEERGDTIDLDDPAGLAEFEQLVADAPAAVRDDLNYFVDQATQFEQLDENDPDAIGEVFGLFLDPQFIESIQGFGTFLRDECDIEVPGLAELENLEPGQLEEELNDLGGELEGGFDELQDQLNSELDDLQQQLEDEFGDLEEAPDTSTGG